MTVLSIDGGTTNTRLVLIQSGEILAAEKFGLGARNSVSDGAFSYAEHLTDAVTDFLGRQADVPEVALASGMICSEAGLGLSPMFRRRRMPMHWRQRRFCSDFKVCRI